MMNNLMARYIGRTRGGRRKYTLRNSQAADLFVTRARKRGFRTESLYAALGCIEVQVLTERENRREYEREQEQEEALYRGVWLLA